MKKHLLELDGFRAIAVTFVVLFHLEIYTSIIPGYNTIIGTGHFGVYLFFILSGFLLSTPYLIAAKENQQFPDTINFYKRRVLRIFPLYYLALLLYIPYYYLTFNLFEFKPYHVLAYDKNINYVNYFFNFLFSGDESTVNPVLWTLKIEVVFYLMLPIIGYILYILLTRKKYILFLVVLSAGLIISPVYRYLNYDKPKIGASFFSNLDTFFYGIICATFFVFFIEGKERKIAVTGKFILYTIILLSVFSYYLISYAYEKNGTFPYHSHLILLNIILSICIMSTLYLKDSLWNSFLTSRAMFFISTISYSLYIWHFWIYYLFQAFAEYIGFDARKNYGTSLTIKFVSLVVTISISALVYNFFEKPFLKRKPSMLK